MEALSVSANAANQTVSVRRSYEDLSARLQHPGQLTKTARRVHHVFDYMVVEYEVKPCIGEWQRANVRLLESQGRSCGEGISTIQPSIDGLDLDVQCLSKIQCLVTLTAARDKEPRPGR